MYKYDIRLLGVQTGSMEPAIKVGDGLISHPVELNELTAGEIVNYQTDSGATISHRIVKVDSQKQHLITKGDNNKEPDGIVASSQIISQPAVILPYAGSIISHLQKPIVLISLVYVPATLILTREITRFNSERQRLYRLEI
jgi:signal peptidase I